MPRWRRHPASRARSTPTVATEMRKSPTPICSSDSASKAITSASAGRASLADELDAHLRHLARFRLWTAFCLAEDAFLIAEAERPRLPCEARCAHARDLQRHVGAQREQVAARVEKLERGPRHAPPAFMTSMISSVGVSTGT